MVQKALFDARYDRVMQTAQALTAHRLAMASGLAVLTAPLLGPRIAIGWAAVTGVSEIVIWIVNQCFFTDLDRVTVRRRAAGVLALTLNHVTWYSLMGFMWLDPRAGVKAMAVVFWFGSLIYNQAHSFRSPGAVMMFSVLLGGLAVFFVCTMGPVETVERVGLCVGFLLASYNSLMAGLFSYNAAAKLEETAEALRAETRAAEAANAAKSRFLAMMSHELRTPMNGVLGLAHALRAGPLTPGQADMVETQIRSGDALMTILNDILDLSKIEAGRVELDYGPVDLRALVEGVMRLWEHAAAEKGVELRTRIADDLPAAVRADEPHLRQILLNLTSNALKFTASGSVSVEVEWAGAATGPGRVRIAVVDSGTGVPEELQSRLFTAFSQAEGSARRSTGGTGLGLAIARNLAELMGGDLRLADSSPRGSTFALDFPAEPTVAPAVQAPRPEDAACAPDMDVLVVEDNAVNRQVIAALLAPFGCRVEMACDGREALDALSRAAFDLVLMDINMPVMDGIEAVQRIRRGEAGDPGVPVVALTAHAMTDERKRLLASGFDDFCAKPIQPAELLRVLSSVCQAASEELSAEAA